MIDRADFLPVSAEDMHERGWWWYDFLVVGGDAYIDHPSFGTAVIARVLEAEGYRVAVLCQPDWHSAEAFRATTRRQSTVGARISTLPAIRRACGPTGPSSSTQTARGRPSGLKCP